MAEEMEGGRGDPPETGGSPTDEPDPRVVGVDSDDADRLIGALSSDTARDILACVDEEAATASEIAERLDTTIQNVRYHLEGLEDAGLVEVADTRYSPKGREMSVYGLASGPVVVFPGSEGDRSRLERALVDLLAGVAVVAVGAAVLQRIWTTVGGGGEGAEAAPTAAGDETFQAEVDGAAAGGAGDNASPRVATEDAEGGAATEQADAAGDAGADLLVQLVDLLGEPGVAFLLGGAVALAVAAALRYRWGDGDA